MDHALHEHDNIRAGLVRLAELLEQLARFGNPVQQIRGSQRQILGQNRSQDGKKRLIVRDGQKMTLLILHKINDGIFILLLPAPDGRFIDRHCCPPSLHPPAPHAGIMIYMTEHAPSPCVPSLLSCSLPQMMSKNFSGPCVPAARPSACDAHSCVPARQVRPAG